MQPDQKARTLPRRDPHEVLRRSAEDTIRRAARASVIDSVATYQSLAEQLDAIEDALCNALADPSIAWALAYVAGVQMAPELLKRAAHTPAAQPPAERGGSR